jgi:uncharacterized protein
MALSTRIGHDPEDRSRKKDPMVHEREGLQTIHEVYAAFGKGDVPDVLAMLSEGVRWFTPGPPEVIPYAGLRHGRHEVAGYFTAFGKAVGVSRFEPQKFFASDDTVVVLGHHTM